MKKIGRFSRPLCAIFLLSSLSAVLSPVQAASNVPTVKLPELKPLDGDGEWTGSLGLGATFSRGNTDSSQVSMNGDATRTTLANRIVMNGIAIRARSNGTETADNFLVSGRYEKNLSTEWFGFGEANYERDKFADLSLRQTYAAGAGYRFYETPNLKLNLYSGAAQIYENNFLREDTHGVELLVGNDLTYNLSENAVFKQSIAYYPEMTSNRGGHYIFQSSLSSKLIGPLALQVSLIHKYRKNVLPGDKNYDTLLTTGVSMKF